MPHSMPAPPANSPRSSISTTLYCYISACLHLVFIRIILKTLEMSERVLTFVLAVAAGDRGKSRAGAKPAKSMEILDQGDLGVPSAGGCDIIRQEEHRGDLHRVSEIRLESLDAENQIGEDELKSVDELGVEKPSQLCESITEAKKHVCRWGAAPGSEERGKQKMEYTDSPDSPCVGQMDTSPSDIFDGMSSVEYDAHMLLRPFALNGDLARTVATALSGDSIASDDPFLPPGLGSLALSLTPRRAFSTCIQPGSAAASSNRSRMSFASLLANDVMLGSGTGELDEYIKASPLELMKAAPRASRFGRDVDRENGDTPVKTHTTATTSVNLILKSNPSAQTGSGVSCDPMAIITKTKTNTPVQIYRALSTLSFWTPAPKIAVTIAPPVKRRRGVRRRDKARSKGGKSENTSYDVFGERMLLQPMGQN